MIEPINTGYIQKATRLSQYDVAESVEQILYGQHFHLNDDGEWEYADGTKRSYPTMNNRYQGKGYGLQGELLEGRDDVSAINKITVLVTNFEIQTQVYDKEETYEHGMPLAVKEGGVIVPFDEGEHKTEFIIGYVTRVPEDEDDALVYQG